MTEYTKPKLQEWQQQRMEDVRENGQLMGRDECGNLIRFKSHPQNTERFQRMDEVEQGVLYKPLDGRSPEEGEGLIIIHPDGREEKVKSYGDPTLMGPQQNAPMKEQADECGRDDLSAIHKASQGRMDSILLDAKSEINLLQGYECDELVADAFETKLCAVPNVAMQTESPAAMRA